MTPPETVVSVHELTKIYGSVAAVDGVSFEIARGETFALLGPNGAGKSTTIEILEGYRRRTGGEVRVLGADPSHADLAWKARLGIVLQSSGEQGAVTVREQLSHFASLYPHPRDVDEVIAAVGLEHKAGALIRTLSGGQRRRVDVGVGIIGRPELLFLDEPTTGFNPEARRQFWDLVRTLQDEGTSILLTTHYLDEASQLSDRAGIIAAGRMVGIGPVGEIGGRDARTPIVRWTEQGDVREERTDSPAAVVAHLIQRLGGEPEGLEVIRPSLEDVYLDLVGREHADELSGAPS
ncbi:ABC transporter ATP-binding protein [Microcella daejeonensis]|uniref:ABC transporter ATP-binding protein n=1 Tax=Microcella daejeonensis TaxID=2994971 RepID=A0A9E8S8W2_9MICO|nr:ABC transporter ATP-binding protein [Microcella daejeonensis]WAB82040.1 ABC transporter ATP-binding protein [Microcella daejeonensis]